MPVGWTSAIRRRDPPRRRRPARPMLVGHDPDFSELAADLSGVPTLEMKKGALVRIDVAPPIEPGGGILRWLVPPDALPGE